MVDVAYEASWGGTGGETAADVASLLTAVLRRRLSSPTGCGPAPDAVVVPLGGNALTTRATPHLVGDDVPGVTAAVADNVRWLLGCLAMFGAPDTTVILMTAVPRAQLTDDGLSAFRQLSDALRGVAAEYAPRCVFLDVERLLAAERSAPDS